MSDMVALRRRLRVATSAAWLVFLVLFALFNGVSLVAAIVNYEHQEPRFRPPIATLVLQALALVAALAATVAARHRALGRVGRPGVSAGVSLTAVAIFLLLLAGFIGLASGPH